MLSYLGIWGLGFRVHICYNYSKGPLKKIVSVIVGIWGVGSMVHIYYNYNKGPPKIV